MTFSIQTLAALTTSLALAFTCLRSFDVGVGVIFIAIPFTMALIGLTSPQRGNQLDPSKRWYLFFLAKTWVFTLALLALVSVAGEASPSLKYRLSRAMNGDFRRYRIEISLPTASLIGDALMGKHWQLYDSQGFVGEVRDVYRPDVFYLGNGKRVETQLKLLVSTNREDAKQRRGKEFEVNIRSDGTLFLID